VALFVALGGGAYAATSSDNKTDKKIANKAAKSYFNGHISSASVSHANTANSATSATNATNATNANTATNATQLGGQPASAYATATPLAITAATLQNSWTQASGFGATAQGFAKDQFGIVHLSGAVVHGTSSTTVIFTLPAGDRPAGDIDVPDAAFGGVAGVLRINTDGTVQPIGTATAFVDLDGITFIAGG
jgi:hypothetical protein